MRIVDFRVQVPKVRRSVERADFMLRYNDVFDLEAVSYTEDELAQALHQAGIEAAVLQAEWDSGDYRALNDRVAELVARHPQFTGFGAVDPADGYAAAQEVRRCVEDLGLVGVNIQPFASRVHADAAVCYPVYTRCRDYDIPVTIHTGINYSSNKSLEFGRPIHVDQVACDFPGLKIVMNHGGWPWVPEAVAIARKHATVYLEIGGIAPKYIARDRTGWEVFLQFANSLLSDQILFATDSMLPFARAVEEAMALPLKPQTLEKLMGGNARRLLGKPPATAAAP
jgi:predicted TIM-barrel fold metal-dependent hydrolase